MDVGIVDELEHEQELRDIVRLYDVHEGEQARQRQREILSIVKSLGDDRRVFRRERARRAKGIGSSTPAAHWR